MLAAEFHGSPKRVGERMICAIAPAGPGPWPAASKQCNYCDTRTGARIPDFVNLHDVASAHVAAARGLAGAVESLTLTVDDGEGKSLRTMVTMSRSASGTAYEAWSEPVVESCRSGAPARVVEHAELIGLRLGCPARYGVIQRLPSAWECWQATKGSSGQAQRASEAGA